jgi:SAM-dependent methyltransferase
MLFTRLCGSSRLYNLLQRFVGASRDRAAFVRTHVVSRPGDEIVDAGCGTGSALEFLLPVTYFGFDPNADYIRVAQSRYGDRDVFCSEMPAAHECGS